MILRIELFLVLILLVSYFAYHIGSKSKSVVAGLLSGWILISGIMVSHNPGIVSSIIDMRLRVIAAKGFCVVSMFLFLISTIDRKWVSSMFLFFEIMAIIQTILLLKYGVGLFSADSMDAAFVAVILPISFLRPKQYPYWFQFILMAIPPFILFAPRLGNTFFVALATMTFSYLALKRKRIALILTIPLIAGIMALSYRMNGISFFRHADRTEQWKFFMNWLFENEKQWLGTGLSTFQWVGPILQNKTTDIFIWMHSEPLQIIFEQGLLGFALALILTYQCLSRSVKTPWLFVASIGLITISLTQFPLRYPVGQFLTLLLIRASLLGEVDEMES